MQEKEKLLVALAGLVSGGGNMKFKINNREWTITEVSQGEIKNIQNIRRANQDENTKSIDTRYYGMLST